MQNSPLDHPTEDELERFLLNKSQEEELEIIETHVLACESCVARLEALEMEIATMKLALEQLQSQAKRKELRKTGHPSKHWLTTPSLSWAGAAVVLVLSSTFLAQVAYRYSQSPVEVSLRAYRGLEFPVVPVNRPLHVRLNARELTEGPVRAQIVNDGGSEIWTGTTSVRQDVAEINVPGIRKTGAYFLRLYSPGQPNAEGELLREFAFRAK